MKSIIFPKQEHKRNRGYFKQLHSVLWNEGGSVQTQIQNFQRVFVVITEEAQKADYNIRFALSTVLSEDDNQEEAIDTYRQLAELTEQVEVITFREIFLDLSLFLFENTEDPKDKQRMLLAGLDRIVIGTFSHRAVLTSESRIREDAPKLVLQYGTRLLVVLLEDKTTSEIITSQLVTAEVWKPVSALLRTTFKPLHGDQHSTTRRRFTVFTVASRERPLTARSDPMKTSRTHLSSDWGEQAPLSPSSQVTSLHSGGSGGTTNRPTTQGSGERRKKRTASPGPSSTMGTAGISDSDEDRESLESFSSSVAIGGLELGFSDDHCNTAIISAAVTVLSLWSDTCDLSRDLTATTASTLVDMLNKGLSYDSPLCNHVLNLLANMSENKDTISTIIEPSLLRRAVTIVVEGTDDYDTMADSMSHSIAAKAFRLLFNCLQLNYVFTDVVPSASSTNFASTSASFTIEDKDKDKEKEKDRIPTPITATSTCSEGSSANSSQAAIVVSATSNHSGPLDMRHDTQYAPPPQTQVIIADIHWFYSCGGLSAVFSHVHDSLSSVSLSSHEIPLDYLSYLLYGLGYLSMFAQHEEQYHVEMINKGVFRVILQTLPYIDFKNNVEYLPFVSYAVGALTHLCGRNTLNKRSLTRDPHYTELSTLLVSSVRFTEITNSILFLMEGVIVDDPECPLLSNEDPSQPSVPAYDTITALCAAFNSLCNLGGMNSSTVNSVVTLQLILNLLIHLSRDDANAKQIVKSMHRIHFLSAMWDSNTVVVDCTSILIRSLARNTHNALALFDKVNVSEFRQLEWAEQRVRELATQSDVRQEILDRGLAQEDTLDYQEPPKSARIASARHKPAVSSQHTHALPVQRMRRTNSIYEALSTHRSFTSGQSVTSLFSDDASTRSSVSSDGTTLANFTFGETASISKQTTKSEHRLTAHHSVRFKTDELESPDQSPRKELQSMSASAHSLPHSPSSAVTAPPTKSVHIDHRLEKVGAIVLGSASTTVTTTVSARGRKSSLKHAGSGLSLNHRRASASAIAAAAASAQIVGQSQQVLVTTVRVVISCDLSPKVHRCKRVYYGMTEEERREAEDAPMFDFEETQTEYLERKDSLVRDLNSVFEMDQVEDIAVNGSIEQQHKSAVLIQKTVRGALTREKIAQHIVLSTFLEVYALISEQEDFQFDELLHLSHQDILGMLVLRLWKLFKARKELRRRKQEYTAATQIQCIARGWNARKQMQQARENNHAATRVQAAWRMHMAQRKIGEIKHIQAQEVVLGMQATRVQACWKSYSVRKRKAEHQRQEEENKILANKTLLIQLAFRRWKSLKQTNQLREERKLKNAAENIQRLWKGHVTRYQVNEVKGDLKRAEKALEIQRIYRGHKGRQCYQAAQLRAAQTSAAVSIQCAIRKHHARKRLAEQFVSKVHNTAPTIIQRHWRGYKCRTIYQRFKHTVVQINRAALAIQRNWRGYYYRKYLNGMIVHHLKCRKTAADQLRLAVALEQAFLDTMGAYTNAMQTRADMLAKQRQKDHQKRQAAAAEVECGRPPLSLSSQQRRRELALQRDEVFWADDATINNSIYGVDFVNTVSSILNANNTKNSKTSNTKPQSSQRNAQRTEHNVHRESIKNISNINVNSGNTDNAVAQQYQEMLGIDTENWDVDTDDLCKLFLTQIRLAHVKEKNKITPHVSKKLGYRQYLSETMKVNMHNIANIPYKPADEPTNITLDDPRVWHPLPSVLLADKVKSNNPATLSAVSSDMGNSLFRKQIEQETERSAAARENLPINRKKRLRQTSTNNPNNSSNIKEGDSTRHPQTKANYNTPLLQRHKGQYIHEVSAYNKHFFASAYTQPVFRKSTAVAPVKLQPQQRGSSRSSSKPPTAQARSSSSGGRPPNHNSNKPNMRHTPTKPSLWDDPPPMPPSLRPPSAEAPHRAPSPLTTPNPHPHTHAAEMPPLGQKGRNNAVGEGTVHLPSIGVSGGKKSKQMAADSFVAQVNTSPQVAALAGSNIEVLSHSKIGIVHTLSSMKKKN